MLPSLSFGGSTLSLLADVGALKDPLARDQNLVVVVPDARKFALLKRYRVACDVSNDPSAPLSAELRGFVASP